MKHLALISLVFMTVAACGGKKTEAAKSAPAAPKIEQSTGDAGTKASDLVGTWAVCSFEGSVGLRVTIKFDAKGNLETSAGAYKDSRCKNIMSEADLDELFKDSSAEDKAEAKASLKGEAVKGTYKVGKALADGLELDLTTEGETEFSAFKIVSGKLYLSSFCFDCQDRDDDTLGTTPAKRIKDFADAGVFTKQ